MRKLLEVILPKILPDDFERPLVITHSGKSDLAKSIPRKLRAWQEPNDKFVILHDQDGSDCVQLKTELLSLCKNSKNDCLIRIVCNELESWFFGDLAAISLAYDRDYMQLGAKRKYRTPDNLSNAKEELRKLIPEYQPISGAGRIAAHMDLDNNSSRSFNVFISGVKKVYNA
jgi:hypothetical protein